MLGPMFYYTVLSDATKAFVNTGKLFRIVINKNISMIVLRCMKNTNYE